MRRVNLHDGTEVIEEYAFDNTRLTEIFLPSSVKLWPDVPIANSDVKVHQAPPHKGKEVRTLEELEVLKKELEDRLIEVNDQIRNMKKTNNPEKDTLHKRGAESFDR